MVNRSSVPVTPDIIIDAAATNSVPEAVQQCNNDDANVVGSVASQEAPLDYDSLAGPTVVTLPVQASHIEVSPRNFYLEGIKESNLVDQSTMAVVDDLVTLATISELENMITSPAFICINETTESPVLESATTLPVDNISATLAPLEDCSVQKKSIKFTEHSLGSNKFASLLSLEEEEDSLDSVEETDSMDFMTLSGKRILRERPVKPSAKTREILLQSSVYGRGNHGCGNRGRGNRGGRG
ncbi:Uncharacterized protein Rs2_43680 [Raphanus sativus]|nr:Uncharacterized protein Rs2_43680 [Raphanus sativus]